MYSKTLEAYEKRTLPNPRQPPEQMHPHTPPAARVRIAQRVTYGTTTTHPVHLPGNGKHGGGTGRVGRVERERRTRQASDTRVGQDRDRGRGESR